MTDSSHLARIKDSAARTWPTTTRIVASEEILLNEKTLERIARRIVPSTSLLSHNFFFKCIVDGSDWLPRLIWPEFRKLPPNHLRIRVGVGNRFFSNQVGYLAGAEAFWLYYMGTGAVTPASTIVDIGCGCGRFAHHMRDFDYQDTVFTGKYIGVDIDEEMLAWCRNNFDEPRFEFLRSSHASKSYNQAGTGSEAYSIPVADGAANFVFSRSLFTHLLEPELKNYLVESVRILRPGGKMVMSFFSLDYPPPTFGGRHTFGHQIGNSAVESLAVPEAAVAYREAFLLGLAREVGFPEAEVVGRSPQGWQRDLVASR